MRISEDEVKHIAKLSRLQFDENGVKEMAGHLSTVLGYFEMLDSVDTSLVPPTAHILDKVNVLREDEPQERPFDREQLLKNAPESDGEAYIVPRVLE